MLTCKVGCCASIDYQIHLAFDRMGSSPSSKPISPNPTSLWLHLISYHYLLFGERFTRKYVDWWENEHIQYASRRNIFNLCLKQPMFFSLAYLYILVRYLLYNEDHSSSFQRWHLLYHQLANEGPRTTTVALLLIWTSMTWISCKLGYMYSNHTWHVCKQRFLYCMDTFYASKYYNIFIFLF